MRVVGVCGDIYIKVCSSNVFLFNLFQKYDIRASVRRIIIYGTP